MMKRARALLAALVALVMVASMAPTCALASGGSELTVAVGYQFTTLDPALNTEIANLYVLTHLYSG